MTESEMNLAFLGRRVICMVAQAPFEHPRSHANGSDWFCTLRPLASEQGEKLSLSSFPQNGLVWWMVAESDLALAQVGRVVSVSLEKSNKGGEEGADWYQAMRQDVKAKFGCTEVLNLEDGLVGHIAHLLRAPLVWPRPVEGQVVIRWMGRMYGPWKATSAKREVEGYAITLETEMHSAGKPHVYELEDDGGSLWRNLTMFRYTAEVSCNDAACHHSHSDRTTMNAYVVPNAYLHQSLYASPKIRIQDDLTFLQEVVSKYGVLNQDARGRFLELLEELRSDVLKKHHHDNAEVVRACERIRQGLEVTDEYAVEIARGLVTQGFLQRHVEEAVTHAVEQQQVEISTQVAEAIAALEETKGSLQKECDALDSRRGSVAAEIEELINKEKRRFDRECAEERTRIYGERERLAAKEQSAQALLDQLSDRLRDGREALLADYLLLGSLIDRPSEDEPSGDGKAANLVETGSVKDESDAIRAVEEWNDFIESIAWPSVRTAEPRANRLQSVWLMAGGLACRVFLVPHLGWARSFAEALGAAHEVAHVEPDWIRFSALWESDFKELWRFGEAHPSQLSCVTLDGINRSPTTAWAQPLLALAGGLRSRLPGRPSNGWPENIRIFATVDDDSACFDLAAVWSQVAGAVTLRLSEHPAGEGEGEARAGRVCGSALSRWRAGRAVKKEHRDPTWECSAFGPYRPFAMVECERLAGVLCGVGFSEEESWRHAIRCRFEFPLEYGELKK